MTAERGFHHPSLGYWQTVGDVPAEVRNRYPAGTVEVPVRPGPDYNWQTNAWVYVAPESEAPAVPEVVPKLALVRAMRLVQLSGAPATLESGSIWDVVKAAISSIGGDVEEDWQLAVVMPRLDPALNALAGGLVPDPVVRNGLLDSLFVLAGQIDRGEVTP